MLSDPVKANRSCRRFDEDQKVALNTLKEIVEINFLTPTVSNDKLSSKMCRIEQRKLSRFNWLDLSCDNSDEHEDEREDAAG